jgi:cysteine desulfuration protein SufE
VEAQPVNASAVELAEKLARLKEELGPFDDPQERLAFLVDRARRAPALPPEQRVDANRVTGCVSVVWLAGRAGPEACEFHAYADSPVVHGLLRLLCDFYGGATAAEVADCGIDPLAELGITRDLSPTRVNGLASARARIREIARAAISARC